MKKLIIVLLVTLTLTLKVTAQIKKLIRVYLKDPYQAEELVSYHLDFASRHIRRYADVVVTEQEEQFLLQKGFKLETLMEDLARSFKEKIAAKTDMGDYHTYQEMYEEMVDISNNYPNITMLTSIGQSIEGRDIWTMKVSDNPILEEDDEPDLLYMGNMHAREVITPEIILYFLNYLVGNYGVDPEVTDLVDNREFWLIPTQNPDGHVYVEDVDPWWRKNRRDNGDGTFGVDLNRNYGYMWGYDDKGSSPFSWSETYRGTAPFSESESQTIRELCMSHHFVLSLSYHSYGRLWLFPWGYIPENTPHHEVFLELANNCVAFNGYTPGNGAMGVIYLTNGDTDDYFYGEQAEKNMFFGFTPEVGDEFWPPESQIPILCEENLGPNLYLAKIAPIIEDNPYRIFRPASPVIDPMDTDNDGNYVVSWSIDDDPDNPAILYRLDELSGFTAITDDAEGGEANWEFKDFSLSLARYHSSSHSYYSGQGDNLNRNMTTALQMIVEDISELSFWTWYNIEQDWDYAYVEISNDGGATFKSIPGNITTNYNPHGNNLGNGITGSSGGWIQGIFDLSDFIGQTIFIRFRYMTDQYISEEGFYVDDVFPVPTYETVLTLADDIAETFYTISGNGDGIYYYQVRAQDAEEQWGAWSALEDIVVDVSQEPTIIVSAPNGGEVWGIGKEFNITWTTKNFIGDLRIEYSDDAGSSWIEITASTPDDGSYLWTVFGGCSLEGLVKISDAIDGDLTDLSDSTFIVGSKGDVNCDGEVDIFDLVKVINFILDKVEPTPYELWAADMNDDVVLDIFDVVKMIKIILGGDITTLTKMAASPAQIGELTLPDVELKPEHTTEVPVNANFDGTVVGIQLVLRYDPQVLKVSTPVLTSRTEQMELASADKDGKLTILIYSASGNVIEAGSDPIVNLRVETLSGFNGSTGLKIDNAIAVNGKAEAISVNFFNGNIAVAKPKSYVLSQNYPNPFNAQTVIKYQLPKSDRVVLKIYNNLGQEIKTLVDEDQEAGYYNVNWDGRDNEGKRVSSGIYIYRIQAGDFVRVKKMLFVM